MADKLNATLSQINDVIEPPPSNDDDSVCPDQQQHHHYHHNHSNSNNHHPHRQQLPPTSTQSQINSVEQQQIQQLMAAAGPSDADQQHNHLCTIIDHCSNPEGCMSLLDILKSFNAPISEEQAWALIYQSVRLYRDACQRPDFSVQICRPPMSMKHLHVHKDGSVHISVDETERRRPCFFATQKKILVKLGLIVFKALDYNLHSSDDCNTSPQLEQVIQIMTMTQEDADDEGIERDSDEIDGDKFRDTKDLDHILELCSPRVLPTKPNEHYKAVCRALATESLELRVFLQKIFLGDTEQLRLKADIESSKHELQKLGFSDWARFWMQVVDELRRGVRLKKSNFPRAPLEFELTPYEILMEDIRSRKYNLRKVMINGDVPQRVKKDAHALILEFIRSRPPLRKASERKLLPPKHDPTPREQLLESIRTGHTLKHVQPKLQTNLLPTTQSDNVNEECQKNQPQNTKSRRLIKVDLSLFEDEGWNFSELGPASLIASNPSSQNSSFTQYQQINNENNPNDINTAVVYRRKKEDTITHDEYHRFCDNALESYDLATQCESRRASMRRHTIVGCQSNNMECQSTPTSRPESRQSDVFTNPLNPLNPINSSIIDEWTRDIDTTDTSAEAKETDSCSDRLALTLEEIVHIRSVITKAELEGLPVGVRVKEEVERKKICFLCLRTRFRLFQWGVQCKLCKRTVCSKCCSKMRIPTQHFKNVPVVLLSPSLMSSPISSTAPSPSHHAHILTTSSGPSSGFDDSFPKSLMERLLRSETLSKSHQAIGSAPSSPKIYHSTSSTPGGAANGSVTQMTQSMGGLPATNNDGSESVVVNQSNRDSVMSRSMEGPRSLPPQSPARPHSNSSTLDRRLHISDQKEQLQGEMMNVCNDCRGLVYEIIRSSKQTRSTARNKALRNLTLDLSPVYKRW